MSTRDAMLARIAAALEGADQIPPPKRDYGATTPLSDNAATFVERVEDYRAVVERITPEGVAAAVAAALTRATRVVVPPGLPREWVAALDGAEVVADDGDLSPDELDHFDAVVTAAAVGIAVTGTIVLDHGPGQGRRALSLLPDYHLCVVLAAQVVGLVPEAIGGLEPAARERRPLTFISGPSATSDIELNRVEGVHGPRTLEVLIVRSDS